MLNDIFKSNDIQAKHIVFKYQRVDLAFRILVSMDVDDWMYNHRNCLDDTKQDEHCAENCDENVHDLEVVG